MTFPTPARRILPRFALALLAVGLARVAGAAESTPPAATPSSGWNLPDFIDSLPDILSERLPGFDRTGAVRLYVRPHFGDFIHRDYVRIPVGARAKITENFESSLELESYLTHGIADTAGYGFANLRLGAKCEHVLPDIWKGGVSMGLNYQTPLSRPPIELTDGNRHLQPYVAATRPFLPRWPLLGYATVSADLMDHTVLPDHFGRNQLHTNSLTVSAGVAHEWPRFQGSLTASVTTSALMSDEGKQVFTLRPEIVVPWKSTTGSKTQVLFKLGGRAIHGPDGTELGMSGSMRIEFKLNRRAK